MNDLPGQILQSSGAPGSQADIQARLDGAWQGLVLRLRYAGVYMPVQILRDRPVARGYVVSLQFDRAWFSKVYASDGKAELLRQLMDPVVRKKRADGCLLVDGKEWDEGYLQQWEQTWLLAPTPQLMQRALSGMESWLRARYTGKLHMP
ncbi:hypothetical protein [Acidovorax sp.]|uniref:hypothetical protein n=1 Tax=Acidovorax sp. TaxID=1872122 RepID=UPI002ACDB060|nr:hypothetical protein [Acidovorax sp.]MDZ7862688.1 hypothetical protein [Acidovorax sp.]